MPFGKISLSDNLKESAEEVIRAEEENIVKAKQAHVRYNIVYLYGAVLKAPQIVHDDDGKPVQAAVSVTVTRGSRNISLLDKKIVYDNPVIRTDKGLLVEEIEKWDVNDIVMVKGVLATKNAGRPSYCSHCGARNLTPGLLSYVYPIAVRKLYSCPSTEDCLADLQENKELSNSINCFGTLVRDPKLKIPAKGIHLLQFPIGMNRKFVVTQDPPEIRSDYPWVKIYNEMADYNMLKLKLYSVIYIDGFLQTRNVKRITNCESCKKDYDRTERILEISPYMGGIEYISGERSEEEVKKIRETKERKLFEAAGAGRWVTMNASETPDEEDN